ncbi:MAG: T9SS type A sorting domain-containing protein, partial [Bacteroidales bacterium]|nr:T9SS type A sorting domain-containing protein [Bacteroidales bacterium]
DGTTSADILLGGQAINDIYVDGGNRKWLATESAGVFLLSDDGKETIHNFTTSNSPLYSNTVISIGVNEETGEVFMSTDKGLISFMGQATEGDAEFKDVYVYPNPIRPSYEGDITISGLVEETIVKITDISGNVVYETVSLGGQAIWNGRNYEGDRVATGVYMVFLSNSDGSKTHITKLLFIH